jgi:hypothetical protein
MTRHPARASTPYRTGLDGSIEAMRQSDSTRTHEGTTMKNNVRIVTLTHDEHAARPRATPCTVS